MEIKKTTKTRKTRQVQPKLSDNQMAPRKQGKVIKDFQKQSAQVDLTAEEETEDLANQVLDEIGVGVASQLSSVPKGRIGTKNRSSSCYYYQQYGLKR
ncbi:hypothetical protein HID58_010153 [Brassica napus]|uniref:Uncharacterized protein n=1 Tax=Brassica napus TaxID=3708 RepID=A0ABQ8DX80_BRANA|nr:hypothetical protein HID58_010153 [Brassica napus]